MRSLKRMVLPFTTLAGSVSLVAFLVYLGDEGFDDFSPRVAALLTGGVFTLMNTAVSAVSALRRRKRRHRLPARATSPTPPKVQLIAEYLGYDLTALSERERRFAKEYLGGKCMKEIAIDSGLAPSTVRNAFCSIYAKLGVSGSQDFFASGLRNRNALGKGRVSRSKKDSTIEG